MATPAITFVLTQAQAFVAGALTVTELEDRLIGVTFDMHRWGSRDLIRLGDAIERHLWHYARGEMSDAQLRAGIQHIVKDYVVSEHGS